MQCFLDLQQIKNKFMFYLHQKQERAKASLKYHKLCVCGCNLDVTTYEHKTEFIASYTIDNCWNMT